jgi:hypothetical protein
VQVEQRGTDAVFAHRPDAVGDDEPAGFGFDGRAAVADLDGFPTSAGRIRNRVAPEVGLSENMMKRFSSSWRESMA